MGLPRVVLLLALLVISVQAGAGPGSCYLRGVRGCGISKIPIMGPFISFYTMVGDSVVAPTLTDVIRLNDSYLFLLEMPGVTSPTVDIQLDEATGHHVLSVGGMVHDNFSPWPVWERQRGAFNKLFERKFVLPRHADTDKVSHELSDGILKVKVPFTGGVEDVDEVPSKVNGQEEVPSSRLCLNGFLCGMENAQAMIIPEPISNALSDCAGSGGDVITTKPLIDVVGEDKKYILIMEMPGVQSVNLTEELTNGVTPRSILHVTGVAEDTELVRAGKALRLDRGNAPNKQFAVKLSFQPDEVHLEDLSYELSDGLLKLTIPKGIPPQIPSGLRHLIRDELPLSSLMSL